MKYLGFLLCLALSWASTANAQQPHLLYEPVFATKYDPHIVKFDLAPSTIFTRCPDLHGDKLWLFAEWHTQTTDYFIVDGLIEYHPDGPGKPSMEPMDDGLAIAIQGSKCTEEQSNWLLTGEIGPALKPQRATDIESIFNAPYICDRAGTCHYNIPAADDKAVLDGLIDDALARLTKAFGSRERFIAALPESRLKSEDIGPLPYRHLTDFLKGEKIK